MLYDVDGEGVLSCATSPRHDAAVHAELVYTDAVVASLHAAVARACGNVHQLRLLAQRVDRVYALLRQLPDPQPTVPLVNVMRSAALLAARLSLPSSSLLQQQQHHPRRPADHNDDVDEGADGGAATAALCELLQRQFVCAGVFDALQQRLQQTWQLHTTSSWSHESARARADDAVANAELLLQLLQRRHVQQAHTHAQPREAVVGDEAHMTCLVTRPATTPTTTTLTTTQTMMSCMSVDQLCTWQRRRSLSCWRLPRDALLPLSAHVTRRHTHRRPQEQHQRQHCHRFRTIRGLCYDDRPVVVYELNDDDDDDDDDDAEHKDDDKQAQQQQQQQQHDDTNKCVRAVAATSSSSSSSSSSPSLSCCAQTVCSFVQDAVARTRWCHPDLLECLGAYTEKYVTTETAAVATVTSAEGVAAAAAAAAQTPLRLPLPQPCLVLGMIFADVHARSDAVSSPAGRRVWPARVHAAREECEHVVLQSQQQQQQQRQQHIRNARHDNNGTTAAQTPHYESVQHVVYKQHRRLSLSACIDIVLRLCEVLRYVLVDSDSVPAAVAARWVTLPPRNVYIARLRNDADEGGGGGGGDGEHHTADNDSNRSSSSSSSSSSDDDDDDDDDTTRTVNYIRLPDYAHAVVPVRGSYAVKYVPPCCVCRDDDKDNNDSHSSSSSSSDNMTQPRRGTHAARSPACFALARLLLTLRCGAACAQATAAATRAGGSSNNDDEDDDEDEDDEDEDDDEDDAVADERRAAALTQLPAQLRLLCVRAMLPRRATVDTTQATTTTVTTAQIQQGDDVDCAVPSSSCSSALTLSTMYAELRRLRTTLSLHDADTMDTYRP